MVRAVLEGRKTQTRRLANPQPHTVDSDGRWYRMPSGGLSLNCHRSPFGLPGDQLWVRETWFREPHPSEFGLTYNDMPHTWAFACAKTGKYLYRADAGSEVAIDGRRWRPSIHMPRTASRITLEVTDVRVERLQDISEADALAEGVEPEAPDECVIAFQRLWESINGPSSWEANPFVWVVEFKRLEADRG